MTKEITRRELLRLAAKTVIVATAAPGGIEARGFAESLKIVSPKKPNRRDGFINGLRCEHGVDPIGLDEPRPRLSWTVGSGRRKWKQSAYQVRVASGPEKLLKGLADLWDSGKVTSSGQSAEYGGAPLSARQQCFWQARVWSESGAACEWSPVSRWEMGLLTEVDWKNAAWIGRNEKISAPSDLADMNGCFWIWHPEKGGNPSVSASAGTRWFRRIFIIPEGKTVKSALLEISADNSCDARINGHEIVSGGDWARVKVSDAAPSLIPGKNVLAAAAVNESVSPAGLICKLRIEFEQGDVMQIVTDASWKTNQTEAQGWDGADFNDDKWENAFVAGAYGCDPWKMLRLSSLPAYKPAPFLRKEFRPRGRVRRARLSACGLGYADLFLNGKRVNPEFYNGIGFLDSGLRYGP